MHDIPQNPSYPSTKDGGGYPERGNAELRVRSSLVAPPPNLAARPIDHRGFIVPWFVTHKTDAGLWDFVRIHPGRIAQAHKNGLCWLCGRRLAHAKTFVIGPMCAVNRVSAEPPCHFDCATYAAQICPFLTRPMAKRQKREEGDHAPAPGQMIERNPGVTLVWNCARYTVEFVDGGMLFRIGAPSKVRWYCQGREATRQEVLDSIESGIPFLRDVAEEEGPYAVQLFDKLLARAMQLVPAEAAPAPLGKRRRATNELSHTPNRNGQNADAA